MFPNIFGSPQSRTALATCVSNAEVWAQESAEARWQPKQWDLVLASIGYQFPLILCVSHCCLTHIILLRLIDVGATRKFQGKPKRMTSPTLTKTRASGGGFYLTKLRRRLLPKDAWMGNPNQYWILAPSSFQSVVIDIIWFPKLNPMSVHYHYLRSVFVYKAFPAPSTLWPGSIPCRIENWWVQPGTPGRFIWLPNWSAMPVKWWDGRSEWMGLEKSGKVAAAVYSIWSSH